MTGAIESVATRLLVAPLPPELRAYAFDAAQVLLVTVRDRDGAEGTGFTYTLATGGGIVAHMIDELIAPRLVGRPPASWAAVREECATITRRLGPAFLVPALSAVDIAVWDLRGIRSGQPLHAVLGATDPRPVPIYGSGRGGNRLTTDELVEASVGYLADGYPAVKIRAGSRSPAEDAARLHAVRDAVGPDVRLMVDANERLDRTGALDLAGRLADLGADWLEEPLPAEDLAGYIALAAQSPVALATGEHLPDAAGFAQYLALTGVAIYQPDAALGGGITELLRIAELVQSGGRTVAYHSLPELHVHLAVAAGGAYVEDFPVLAALLEPLPVVAGAVQPSDRPGHGIAWDRAAIDRFTVPR